MNIEKWQELKDRIELNFGGFEREVAEDYLEDDLGNKLPQKTESLFFNSPMGKVKLVRVSHPRIVEKKAHYHKGAGSASLEFIVDNQEESAHMTAYIEKDGEWEEFKLPPGSLSF